MRPVKIDQMGPSGRLARQDQVTGARVSIAGFFALMLAAAGLLVLSKLDHTVVRAARSVIVDMLVGPLAVARRASEPLRYWLHEADRYQVLLAQVERLKLENEGLRADSWRAREAEVRIEQLGKLVKAVAERPFPRITARVVVESKGPFSNTVVVQAGREHGVRPGYPVISPEGLVGRVLQAGETSARVLLLSDYASRIPVQIGSKAISAIMLGDDAGPPRIDYLPAGAVVQAGDSVATSGEGGLLPRGLRVGRVVGSERAWRVQIEAGLTGLDYVSILQVETPDSQLWQDDAALPAVSARLRRAAAMRAAAAEAERPR